ncbi:MAG: type II toxin-antitoxin system RelE/ParE family toxin [Candidatus Omnitrophica bacterium]|nr:type II toxin-antitoxin system RelE/ParE family toxin [Candidatus Omnitrophota bacterium]
MSAPRIDLLPEANFEIQESFEWYLERSPRAAESFLFEIDRGIQAVLDSPMQWPPFEAGTRRYLLRNFPFNIIYRVEKDRTLVVAVAHHKRKPGYWRSRGDA